MLNIGFSYYARSSSITPGFYQHILDRCWRRSGKLLYKPDQRRACCPHYTIRLDCKDFKPSRAQRQTINRFNKYILGEEYIEQAARLYPKTKAEAKKRDNEFNMTERVHEALHDRIKTPPQPAHKLEVTLESDEFTEEKFQVYSNYQRVVHNDPPEDRTRSGFTRFLCSSPLRQQEMTGPDGRKRKLGSFHQCYRIDGKLMAIGVLDLLPDCVSSVYFLYHEDIHKFTPGKLGALFEIGLALEGGYRYWYPGYYIHSCPKMRYKIDYGPQYILDPETYKWDFLDKKVLALLDANSYVSLHDEQQKTSSKSDEASATIGVTNGKNQVELVQEEDKYDDGDHSLFNSSMPGLPPIYFIQTLNLDHIALKGMRHGPLFKTSDLVGWESSSVSQWPSIKAGVAELVAALGPECIDVLCLDFTRE